MVLFCCVLNESYSAVKAEAMKINELPTKTSSNRIAPRCDKRNSSEKLGYFFLSGNQLMKNNPSCRDCFGNIYKLLALKIFDSGH